MTSQRKEQYIKEEIRSFWKNLRKEFEEKYAIDFFSDYPKSVPYFERMETFLTDLQKQYPHNTDIICYIACITMELRYGREKSNEKLKAFLDTYQDTPDTEKARIYTNMGYYSDFNEDSKEYLLKAENLNSTYLQTYQGLSLIYFSEYNYLRERDYDKALECLKKSTNYFERVSSQNKNFESLWGYAVCLYELKEYEKAKAIFEVLHAEAPNRKIINLALAYTEIGLNNKAKAKYYLSTIDVNEEEYKKNQSDIDDIEYYQIMNGYYAIDEYDRYIEIATPVLKQYYCGDWEELYYVLWLKGKHDNFNYLVDKYTAYFEESIEDAKQDKELTDEERARDIKVAEKDLEDFHQMILRAKQGLTKPSIHLYLYPEYSCYLIDCIRHATI